MARALSHLRDKPLIVKADGSRVFAYNKDGRAICNSRMTKGRTERCQSTILYSNGRCKIHGGASKGGIFHWKATDLRSAGNLPQHLRGDMNAAMNDPDYISLKHEIALIDTKLAQQKKALELGLGNAAWKKLYTLADRLEYAIDKDPEKSEDLCSELIHTIRSGVKEREVWREIDSSVELLRKLRETAHRREIDLKQLLKADQAIALVTAVASTVKELTAKLFSSIEKRYTLIDNQSGLKVIRIDSSLRLDFLQDVSLGMGGIIGKSKNREAYNPEEQEYVAPTKRRPPKDKSQQQALPDPADYIDAEVATQ